MKAEQKVELQTYAMQLGMVAGSAVAGGALEMGYPLLAAAGGAAAFGFGSFEMREATRVHSQEQALLPPPQRSSLFRSVLIPHTALNILGTALGGKFGYDYIRGDHENLVITGIVAVGAGLLPGLITAVKRETAIERSSYGKAS